MFNSKIFAAVAGLLLVAGKVWAQEAPAPQIDTGDTAWVLTSAALVMLMTPALAFFYAGMVRTKNVVNTMFLNFAAIGVVGLTWAIVGYTLAFGTSQGGLIGGLNYFMLNGVGQTPNADYSATIPHALFMIFQGMFAVITPVLITGAIAERVKFSGFLVFMALWSVIVYAPVAHWVWAVGGFIRQSGAIDFAGGMVVHMTAGFSAIVAVLLLKNRRDFGQAAHKPYDSGMVLLGVGILYCGWFGFNAGSALGANGLTAHAFATTFFAGSAAFLAWMITDMARKGKPSAVGAGIGAIAGLVCITPAAGFVSFPSAILMGLIAGVVCNYACTIVKEKFKLDDTLDVIGCHGVGGLLGTILTSVFASKAVNGAGADGVIHGNWDLLKSHLVGTGYVLAISVIGTVIAYKVADLMFGMRVSPQEEERGLDASLHDEVINSNFDPEHKEPAKPHVKAA